MIREIRVGWWCFIVNCDQLQASVADRKFHSPYRLLVWTTASARLSSIDSGWTAANRKTLEEVGKKFGATRERIRQLQNIALAKLRRALAKREKPIVRRDPVQFLKPVSPDPTRTRLGGAKATIPPKATLDLILESSASDM